LAKSDTENRKDFDALLAVTKDGRFEWIPAKTGLIKSIASDGTKE